MSPAALFEPGSSDLLVEDDALRGEEPLLVGDVQHPAAERLGTHQLHGRSGHRSRDGDGGGAGGGGTGGGESPGAVAALGDEGAAAPEPIRAALARLVSASAFRAGN